MKVVYIKWRDSAGYHGWTDSRTVYKPSVCESVGWLLDANEDHITMALDKTDDGESYGNVCSVPREAIVEYKELEWG